VTKRGARPLANALPESDRWYGPFGDDLRSLVHDNLRRFERRPIRLTGDRRRAAVAVALLDADTNPAVLMIKRSDMGRHSGQWAFPGGVAEPGERAATAALREAREEVGLPRAEVAGRLDDILTGTGFIITPVVVFADTGVRFRRNPDEVHSLHRVGLARLVAPGMPSWARNDSGPDLLQYRLRHDMVVHAPSGAILWQFAEVALQGRPTRVAKLRQPEFALQ
jgi:8-oxo-dGTP pyrophosphatase MutT (NUDIX family)